MTAPEAAESNDGSTSAGGNTQTGQAAGGVQVTAVEGTVEDADDADDSDELPLTGAALGLLLLIGLGSLGTGLVLRRRRREDDVKADAAA